MRALVRYFLLTAVILGLGWASVSLKIGDQTAAAYLRDRGLAWWAERSKPAKPAPEKKKVTKKAKKVVAQTRKRSEREIPPTELQSEPAGKDRVALLANAARAADKKTAERHAARSPTRITTKQKKALDALLTNRQAP